MQRHVVAEPPDTPTSGTQPHAQFRLLTCDQVLAEATDLCERICAHHRNATTRTDLPGWTIPLAIAQPVVNRSLGVAFVQASSDCGNIRVLIEKAHCLFDPTIDKLAISIDELHIGQTGSNLPEPLEASVSRAGRREGRMHVKSDHLRAPLADPLHDRQSNRNSTYTMVGTACSESEKKHLFKRSPSLRPITTAPSFICVFRSAHYCWDFYHSPVPTSKIC